jgi:hypothetical protein
MLDNARYVNVKEKPRDRERPQHELLSLRDLIFVYD